MNTASATQPTPAPATPNNDASARHWVHRYINEGANADFLSYARHYDGGSPDRFFWAMAEIARLARMTPNDRVLDVGCGFGWQAVALAALSGAHLVANDIRPLMTATLADRVAAIQSAGAPIAIEPLTGDICDLNLPDATFDAIICNQTIEHVHDLDRMFATCARLLKPGGRIVVTNDNNARNHRQLAEIRAMWARRDADWTYIAQLQTDRPEENRDIQPYATMRSAMIAQANPQLDAPTIHRLANATAGLTRPTIEHLATHFTPTTTLPTPPSLSWCRNPETGEYCERQLDPTAVANLMQAHGLPTQVRHGFRRPPLNWLNGLVLRPLNDALFQLTPFFFLVGTKSPKATTANPTPTRAPHQRNAAPGLTASRDIPR